MTAVCELYETDDCLRNGEPYAKGLCARHYHRSYRQRTNNNAARRKRYSSDPAVRASAGARAKTYAQGNGPKIKAYQKSYRGRSDYLPRDKGRRYGITAAGYLALVNGGPFGPAACWACGTTDPGLGPRRVRRLLVKAAK